MAPEITKSKKRKGAADSAPESKKHKKADNAATTRKASAKALSAAVNPIDDLPVKSKVQRKPTVQLFDDGHERKEDTSQSRSDKPTGKKNKPSTNGNGVTEISDATEKPKRSRKAKAVEEEVVVVPEVAIEASTVKTKKRPKSKEPEGSGGLPTKVAKKAKFEEDKAITAVDNKKSKRSKAGQKHKEASHEIVAEAAQEEGDDESGDEDDQTAALLAGFESDRDESDLEKDEVDDIHVAKVPKEILSTLENVSQDDKEPGVVFVGRIPHGFYEPQMKAYFSQFGTVTRLRLSRNKRTGASKHYAFVEFASAAVADIVAKTMNNYLMFNHILQCKLVPPTQVHPNLFDGANKRFKSMPRNKMAGAQMVRGAERAVWEKRVANETKRRAGKNKKLKEELGYEYSAPALKHVDGVPRQMVIVQDAAEQQLLLEAPIEETAGIVLTTDLNPSQLIVTETVTSKKQRKGAKGKAKPAVETTVIEEVETGNTKTPKGKEPHSNVDLETVKKDIVVEAEGEAGKTKKAKRVTKTTDATETEINSIVSSKRTRTKSTSNAGAKSKKTKKAEV